MADHARPEPFLTRWSRLRHEAASPKNVPVEQPEVEKVEQSAQPLPSLEGLNAESDFTAFLRQDVPEELRRMGLRQAWTTDATISNFRSFAEYDWDFNALGYGALDPLDQAAAVAEFLGRAVEEDTATPEAEQVIVAEDMTINPDDRR